MVHLATGLIYWYFVNGHLNYYSLYKTVLSLLVKIEILFIELAQLLHIVKI